MINRVTLLGRLTRDPEVKKTQNELSICNFTVACDRDTKEDQADFINCVAFRQQADFVGQYGHKGDVVAVDGRIQTRNYEDRDGKRVYVTEVVADKVKLPKVRQEPTYERTSHMGESVKTRDIEAQDLTGDDLLF